MALDDAVPKCGKWVWVEYGGGSGRGGGVVSLLCDLPKDHEYGPQRTKCSAAPAAKKDDRGK